MPAEVSLAENQMSLYLAHLISIVSISKFFLKVQSGSEPQHWQYTPWSNGSARRQQSPVNAVHCTPHRQ